MDYYDLGAYRRTVSTTSENAEIWFNRGLLWCYSFNHGEALRCFQRAVEYDPQCAMAYWGVAYAIGPNYNKPWIRYDPADFTETVSKAQAALTLATAAQNTKPIEKALIEALSDRFPVEEATPEDFGKLDNAYVKAMRYVFDNFGEDIDVAALFVDAIMCARPRQLWDLDTGKPTGPETLEAMHILEAGLASQDGLDHPAFCHLYIHMMEMAPNPEKAIIAADRLRQLVPDGSHMQHMATHIDIACGDYRRGVDSNQKAMISDDKFFAESTASSLYTAYRSHNIHVLVYAAMMAGRSREAMQASKRITGIITPDLLSIKSPPMVDWVEYQAAMPAHVLIRFGRWEEILQLELPEDKELFCITNAMIHYAQGVALSALGRVQEAELARKEFEAARYEVPENRQYGIACKAGTVFQVASRMLEGELEYRKGNFDQAFAHLRDGVRLEDMLPYADPPVWLQPVRHALGALLLEQGLIDKAKEVYKQDLGLTKKLPRRKARLNNVWALHGLYECLTRSGQSQEAERIRLQRDIAVASADISLGASCFCRLSTVKSCEGCCS
ncbi:TPR domain-containing protein [Fusarium oxysporum f. sp. phaseoli]